MRRLLPVVPLMLGGMLAHAAVTGFEQVVHASTLIARGHVERVGAGEGGWGQKGVVTIKEVIHGPQVQQLDALAQDNSFSGVEVDLLPGNDQLLFLRQEKLGNRDVWVVLEAFVVDAGGTVRLGSGSTTWWVMKPKSYADAVAGIRAELARPVPAPPPRDATKRAPPP
ncbi:MAG: hypothetical protein AB2A00_04255 [Myxococcota bacterium]